MIKESMGIPDIIKSIIGENILEIKNILDDKNNTKLSLNIDKSIVTNNQKRELRCKLVVVFKFSDILNYGGNINFDDCINSDFNNCIINLFIPFKPDIDSVIKTLTHELTHLYEFYQIKDIYDNTRWVKSKKLKNFDGLYNKFDKIVYFRDLFYASLPHEMRSKISSINIYLNLKQTKDRQILIDSLYNSNEWLNYKSLYSFNPIKYLSDLLLEFSEGVIISIFNYFNKLMDIKTRINTKDELVSYLIKTKRYYRTICKSFKNKVFKIINDISNSKEKPYLTESVIDIRYEDYIKKSVSVKRDTLIDDILNTIDYRLFFI